LQNEKHEKVLRQSKMTLFIPRTISLRRSPQTDCGDAAVPGEISIDSLSNLLFCLLLWDFYTHKI